MIDVKQELAVYRQEVGDRLSWDSWWQSIQEVSNPRNAYITREVSPTPYNDYVRIHDTTVIESAEGLSNMMTSQLTPAKQQWVVYLPPFEFEDDEEVVDWYADCSYRAMRLLNQSNFANRMAELNLNRATVGTGAMICDETGNRHAPFRFHFAPIGSYVFDENLEGTADVFKEEFEATAAQLEKRFPTGNFGTKINEALANPDRKYREKFKIVHIIKPREKRDPKKFDNVNFAYADFYIADDDEVLIFETGQHEFPGMVSRFQSGADGSKWGVSPVRKAMPAIAQANFLQEQLDLLLDVQINPRILAEASAVGEINMNPGQKTLLRGGLAGQQHAPVREWLTGGNYPLGKDRIADKQNQIRKLFYHGMWADLARVEKEMTAEEVRAIREQSETLFVGINSRFESDMNPMLSTRMFGICLRAGVFKPIPQQLARETNGFVDLPDPLVSFQTNLSRALRRKVVEDGDAFFLRLERAAQLFGPDVLDEFDIAIHMREVARSFGLKSPTIRSEEEVAEIIAAKVAAQAQQEQMMQAQAGIESASKLPEDIQREMLAGA